MLPALLGVVVGVLGVHLEVEGDWDGSYIPQSGVVDILSSFVRGLLSDPGEVRQIFNYPSV